MSEARLAGLGRRPDSCYLVWRAPGPPLCHLPGNKEVLPPPSLPKPPPSRLPSPSPPPILLVTPGLGEDLWPQSPSPCPNALPGRGCPASPRPTLRSATHFPSAPRPTPLELPSHFFMGRRPVQLLRGLASAVRADDILEMRAILPTENDDGCPRTISRSPGSHGPLPQGPSATQRPSSSRGLQFLSGAPKPFFPSLCLPVGCSLCPFHPSKPLSPFSTAPRHVLYETFQTTQAGGRLPSSRAPGQLVRRGEKGAKPCAAALEGRWGGGEGAQLVPIASPWERS